LSFFVFSICYCGPTPDHSQNEIIEAIKSGKLEYKQNYMHGNPYFRLLRNEVASLVNEKYGNNYLKNKKLENELSQVSKEINRLRKQLASLQRKEAELLENIDE